MKLLHTADWHLGARLAGHPRDAEHRAFMTWLLDLLDAERPDALLICGDVFDASNPPADAQELFFRFLAQARARLPALHIVVIAGNHDGPQRIDAPGPVLATMGVSVVGALPRGADPARAVVALHGPSGDVEAVCAAVPFLRAADLPTPAEDSATPIEDGVRDTYARVLDAARAVRPVGVPLFALGHAHMVGGRLSEDSERPVFGNSHALPLSLFPDDVRYVALGHLHLAQTVGGHAHIRYSGSPLPLSMAERGYTHAVNLVELHGDSTAEARAVPVPRLVQMVRVPAEDHAPLDVVLDALRLLPPKGSSPHAPFLEVRVRVDAPVLDLRARIDDVLADKDARLVRVVREADPQRGTAAEPLVVDKLRDLAPRLVFTRLYERTYKTPTPAPLLEAFDTLLEDVLAGEPPEAAEGA